MSAKKSSLTLCKTGGGATLPPLNAFKIMINEYITYISSIKGYSPLTAQAYRRDLRQFCQFIRQEYPGARWSTVTRSMIDHYVTTMVAHGEQPTTTNRKLAAISGIYRYFIREHKLTDNPAQYESRRKQGERIPNTIDPAQLRTAYEHASGSTRVMLGLLITTGIRISELLALTWEDINLKDNSLKIHGKGMKERIVFTHPEQLAEIRMVIEQSQPTGRIFNYTQYETRCHIYQALLPYCKAPQLSPHAIRHTYATELAKAGVNAPTIARILGHNNIKTTQHYIDNTRIDTKPSALIVTLK